MSARLSSDHDRKNHPSDNVSGTQKNYSLIRAVVYLVAALIMSVAVILFRNWPPVASANNSLLREAQLDLASKIPSEKLPANILFVGFDDSYCSAQKWLSDEDRSNVSHPIQSGLEKPCRSNDVVRRQDITQALTLTHNNPISVVLVDFALLDYGCNDETLDLARAIISASERAFIVIPHLDIKDGPISILGPTIFDQCKEHLSSAHIEYVVRSGRILFGHGILGASPHSSTTDGVPELVVVDLPQEQGRGRWKLVSISLLVGALAQTDAKDSPPSENSGIETSALEANRVLARWKTQTVESMDYRRRSTPKLLLDATETSGEDFEVSGLINGSSFRVAWERLYGNTLTDVNVETRLIGAQYLSASQLRSRMTIDAFYQSDEKPTILVLGSASAGLGDFHRTPLGDVPGAVLQLNIALDYMDGTFVKEATFGALFSNALIILLPFSLLLAVVPSFLAKQEWCKLSEPIVFMIFLSLGSLAIFIIIWRDMITGFENYFATYAFLSLVLLISDAKAVIEDMIQKLIDKLINQNGV